VNSTVISRRVPPRPNDAPDSISWRTSCLGTKLEKLRTIVRMVKTERPSSSISWMAERSRGRSVTWKRWISSVCLASSRSERAISEPIQDASGKAAMTNPSASANKARRSEMISAKNSSSGAMTASLMLAGPAVSMVWKAAT